MNARRKITCALFALCLVAGLLPILPFSAPVALAAGTDKEVMVGSAQVQGAQVDNLYFGNYAQDDWTGYTKDPIKWRVLSNADGKLFLLSNNNLDSIRFNLKLENCNDWDLSTLRLWVAYGFIPEAFVSDEQSALHEIYLKEHDSYDRVFILSKEEATSPAYGFNSDEDRETTGTAYAKENNDRDKSWANIWWLRTPEMGALNTRTHVDVVGAFGSLNPARVSTLVTNDFGVRPALNLSSDSIILTSAAGRYGYGKPSSVGGFDEVEPDNVTDWKVTLKSSSRNSFKASLADDSASADSGYSDWNIDVSYSGAKGGDNEYVSAILCDEAGSVLYYGTVAQNSEAGTGTLKIPTGLAVGSYKLHVFSEQRNGNFKTDFASSFNTIDLTVTEKAGTPSATFTATGDSTGTLGNVSMDMSYSTDGGETWNAITGETAELSGVTAENDVQVKRLGNSALMNDSDPQVIDVTRTQADAPSGLVGVACTTADQNNGQITDVSGTMEYKLTTEAAWKEVPATATVLEGLSNGIYQVRVKAADTALASPAIDVVVGAHTCEAVEGENWVSDSVNHWKKCSSPGCKGEPELAAHSGKNEADCTEGKCGICSEPYKHDFSRGFTAWDENEHWYACNTPGCTGTGNFASHVFRDYKYNNDATSSGNGTETSTCAAPGCGATFTREAVGTMLNTPPTGNVMVGSSAHSFGSFLNKISFNIFSSDGFDINMSAKDEGVGVKGIWYLVSDVPMSAADVVNSTAWSAVDRDNPLRIDKEGNHVVYVKIEGNLDRVVYISSDGLVVDKTAPSVSGIEDGKTYCSAVEVSVSDANLAGATIDGVDAPIVDGKLTVSPKAGAQTVVVSDKAGNSVERTITVNDAHEFAWVIDREATASDTGLKHQKCAVCGYKTMIVEIPALGSGGSGNADVGGSGSTDSGAGAGSDAGSISPNTGDSSIAVLISLVAMLALGTAILAGRRVVRGSRNTK